MKALLSTATAEALVCHLAVAERPIPALRPSTVLVKLRASGVNPSDAANGLKNLFGVSKPNIPGRDFAGVVHAAHSAALPPGTAVYGTSGDSLSFIQDGTAAEFVLVPEAAVVPKPRSLSFVQAGAVGVPYTTALLALEAARTQPGDAVLVLGATGAVGRAAVRIARAWGCPVVTASRRDHNLHLEGVPADLEAQAEGKGKGKGKGKKGPDVVIDAIGSATVMGRAMQILAPRGRYCVLAGFKGEPPEYNLNLVNLYRNAHSICGVNSIAQSPVKWASGCGSLPPCLMSTAWSPRPRRN
jgi:NADPH2:quinone reductase